MPNANQQNITETAAIYAHTNSIAEQTVVTVTPVQYLLFKGIFLDLTNLTQVATIRAMQDINNLSLYRTFETATYTPGVSDSGLLFAEKSPADGPIRITLQSSVLEGASRNVPYEYCYTNLGAAPTS